MLPFPNGLILDFKMYQGKTENFHNIQKQTLGVAIEQFYVLVRCLPGTNIYFDRYFTSVNLLETLKEKEISGTGATMQNMFPND